MAERIEHPDSEDESGGRYPLMPLRDIVVFPHMVVPLFVGRAKSIQAIEGAMERDKHIFLATQKNPKVDDPSEEDLFEVGTLAQILQVLKLPDGTVKVLVEGRSRARIVEFIPNEVSLFAEVEVLEDPSVESPTVEALVRSVNDAFEKYVGLSKKVPPEMVSSVSGILDPSRLGDTIVAQLSIGLADKQLILAAVDPRERLETLLGLMEKEIEILEIEKRIRTRVKSQMERSQKEYYLNEQMRAIQKELGEKDEFKQELRALEEMIKKKKMSKEATDKAFGELRKLRMMSPMSAEATVVRNYLDWLTSLPWRKGTRDNLDTSHAEDVLDADHYGLKKVKERILEYLAVQALVKKIKGPILCLVGPPGVGKTSLGRSIARSLGREFVRISLGGVRDEAEIRGHRRTYIGAMPGKIIQSLRKSGSRNPVFLLDEIDKMSTDFRGDPSSALLEVLDPEQNNTFSDHFLDVDYDLSSVLFVATANNLFAIPRPLQDRMEIIRIEGYTEEEKLNIAVKYLIPKQVEAHGLVAQRVRFSEGALLEIVRRYTREAGVRGLEREIAAICRKIARETVKSRDKRKTFSVSQQRLKHYLGPQRFAYGRREQESRVGLATGLAWTEVGGELLTIETTVLPGQGKLTVTGKLGEVMRESAQAALSYVRSRWDELELERNFYHKLDLHIHVPEGAIPKDGPSAGITMATALASALTGRPIDRSLAMTGEITLRGRVLAIGGLKEKLLAARRAGITRVLIPEDNRKDLAEVPAGVLKALEVIPVAHMDQVLEMALLEKVVEHSDASTEEPLAGGAEALHH
ncbi:ATP-dependent proteinase. Serine peptidase. MEROPS family S16 [Geoalkalibacter ferrihydriticus]|uniref:Lon protease n=1 Tax=Geoalkalibacter ferrihydriticus TaxID=392333 RepID=A0A1G9P8R9_9BACT|nr:endopeptidase La [Geoalkalibacter ferrihydriticus]SDL95186.1 ATP-dependent proteinase. Serine peptidase. MEROPS family S16 [Geoalkalibacter ferrihydriticus]